MPKPKNVVRFPVSMEKLPYGPGLGSIAVDIDSMHRRLCEVLGTLLHELKQFCSDVDHRIARGGMSRQKQAAVFLSQLVAMSSMQKIDQMLPSFSEIHTS